MFTEEKEVLGRDVARSDSHMVCVHGVLHSASSALWRQLAVAGAHFRSMAGCCRTAKGKPSYRPLLVCSKASTAPQGGVMVSHALACPLELGLWLATL